jgi:hypothetical protein
MKQLSFVPQCRRKMVHVTIDSVVLASMTRTVLAEKGRRPKCPPAKHLRTAANQVEAWAYLFNLEAIKGLRRRWSFVFYLHTDGAACTVHFATLKRKIDKEAPLRLSSLPNADFHQQTVLGRLAPDRPPIREMKLNLNGLDPGIRHLGVVWRGGTNRCVWKLSSEVLFSPVRSSRACICVLHSHLFFRAHLLASALCKVQRRGRLRQEERELLQARSASHPTPRCSPQGVEARGAVGKVDISQRMLEISVGLNRLQASGAAQDASPHCVPAVPGNCWVILRGPFQHVSHLYSMFLLVQFLGQTNETARGRHGGEPDRVLWIGWCSWRVQPAPRLSAEGNACVLHVMRLPLEKGF